jgi:formylglycine-generating enzyme required for sulfatase activity
VQTDAHPVVNVTWNDAKAFCAWLGKKERRIYRLPTEAEWEYSCRAGTTDLFHGRLREVGNIADLSLKARWNYSNLLDGEFRQILGGWLDQVSFDDGYPFTAPVGRFQANAWGLHDMHGNVWEWCEDWYGEDYYTRSPKRDPEGRGAGSFHAHRGGSFDFPPRFCRSAFRNRYPPAPCFCSLGFRVVLVR